MVQAITARFPLLAGLYTTSLCLSGATALVDDECPIFFTRSLMCDPVTPPSFLPAGVAKDAVLVGNADTASPNLTILADMLEAIEVMQDDYFAPWLGTWPTSIDWTGAVMGTHVSGALRSFSEAFPSLNADVSPVEDWKLKENLVENYFSQIVSYYFGQNHFEIRSEAYDDILWVVLGWLESVRFVNTHTGLHYELRTQGTETSLGTNDTVPTILRNQTWHGNTWVPGFSHRARVFWQLASKGWDTVLCGGGMTWNPKLLPYKNAITNELWIAASISMYLYFPGDHNSAPFYSLGGQGQEVTASNGTRDPIFLKAAVEGYKWLAGSNMTNAQGLFTDGFHISGYGTPGNNNTLCDQRNEMVFTYNQGVLLTGLRGLWDATGAPSYLSDGHKLIQKVINATGYDIKHDRPFQNLSALPTDELPLWYGLGRAGVLEDQCDASSTCSQDGQTFKGIFFHHLAAFCERLVAPIPEPGTTINAPAFASAQSSHDEACASYGKWLKHNAAAALNTRDAAGKFGSWWTAGLLRDFNGTWPTVATDGIKRDTASVDYRNDGIPNDPLWQLPPPLTDVSDRNEWTRRPVDIEAAGDEQKPFGDAFFLSRCDV